MNQNHNKLIEQINSLEDQLKKKTFDLEERKKELHCLYTISKIAEIKNLDIDVLMQQVVDLIPFGLQYPDISAATAVVLNKTYKNQPHDPSQWNFSAPIKSSGKKIGSLTVYLTRKPDHNPQRPFLEEEQDLINSVCERIGKIIKRIQITERLKEVETRYDLLTERSSQGICILQNNQYQFINEAFIKMTGVNNPKEIIGRPFHDLVSKEFHDQYQAHLEMALNAGPGPYTIEYELHSKQGNRIWVEENQTEIPWNTSPALFCILRDITREKEKELLVNQEKKRLQQENIRLRSSIKDRYRFQNIIGMSQPMQHVYDQILTAANSDANVSIYGESGTGKELVARAIHDLSPREADTFVTINCGAIPEPLMESEFFGYKKGAFTGAVFDKHGYLDLADTGTLFLDEIGDLPVSMQVKLLRAIDGGGYYPIGSRSKHTSDFRIVAATNKNLKQLVGQGLMREDFYYRIQVIPIFLPPLKDRKEDIPLLVDHFTGIYAKNSPLKKIPNHIAAQILNHDWPGNIRELQNALLRFFSTGEFEILNMTAPPIQSHNLKRPVPLGDKNNNLSHAIETIEKEQIINALQSTNWHRSCAAAKLGISRSTLFRRMKKHGLELKQNVRY